MDYELNAANAIRHTKAEIDSSWENYDPGDKPAKWREAEACRLLYKAEKAYSHSEYIRAIEWADKALDVLNGN